MSHAWPETDVELEWESEGKSQQQCKEPESKLDHKSPMPIKDHDHKEPIRTINTEKKTPAKTPHQTPRHSNHDLSDSDSDSEVDTKTNSPVGPVSPPDSEPGSTSKSSSSSSAQTSAQASANVSPHNGEAKSANPTSSIQVIPPIPCRSNGWHNAHVILSKRNGPLVQYCTFHRLWLTALLLAHKVLEDCIVHGLNRELAKLTRTPLKDMNRQELQFLILLQFDVAVSQAQFVASCSTLMHYRRLQTLSLELDQLYGLEDQPEYDEMKCFVHEVAMSNVDRLGGYGYGLGPSSYRDSPRL